jgi:hypothetical protein
MITTNINQTHLGKLALTIVSAGVCLMLSGCFFASYSSDSGTVPDVAGPSETSSTTTTTSAAVPATVERQRSTTTTTSVGLP